MIVTNTSDTIRWWVVLDGVQAVKIVIFCFVFYSTAMIGATYQVVTCKVAVNKGYEPEASCTKTDIKKRQSSLFVKQAHGDWLNDFTKVNPSLKCYDKLEKDRTYYQRLTICHDQNNTSFRVFTSHTPRDYRAILFVNGLRMKWHENKMSYYLHNKLLLPPPKYKAWLLTK